MVEFPQSAPNLTRSSQNLYELLKSGGIVLYADPDIRLACQRSIAIETARGWRIAKDKTSHKIDVVVALGMAAIAAVRWGECDQPQSVGVPICFIGDRRLKFSTWRH